MQRLIPEVLAIVEQRRVPTTREPHSTDGVLTGYSWTWEGVTGKVLKIDAWFVPQKAAEFSVGGQPHLHLFLAPRNISISWRKRMFTLSSSDTPESTICFYPNPGEDTDGAIDGLAQLLRTTVMSPEPASA